VSWHRLRVFLAIAMPMSACAFTGCRLKFAKGRSVPCLRTVLRRGMLERDATTVLTLSMWWAMARPIYLWGQRLS